MTDNTNIQILEALGYWDAGPFKGWLSVLRFIRRANRRLKIGYTSTQRAAAADYAIKNRLNMERDR